MSCTCQKCGNQFKVDLNIPDQIWDLISEGKNLLCGVCIMKALERLSKYGYLNVGDGDGGIAI